MQFFKKINFSHGCTCFPHLEHPSLLPPSPSHSSGSSQCSSPEHPVSCTEPGLAIHFTYDNILVPMLFSQIIPPSPSPTESTKLFFTSVSPLLSRIQGHHYYLCSFVSYILSIEPVKLLSHVRPFAIPWTVAYQALPSMDFQARVLLEWVAIFFSRRSSQSRDLNLGLRHCRQMLYRLSYQGIILSIKSLKM